MCVCVCVCVYVCVSASLSLSLSLSLTRSLSHSLTLSLSHSLSVCLSFSFSLAHSLANALARFLSRSLAIALSLPLSLLPPSPSRALSHPPTYSLTPSLTHKNLRTQIENLIKWVMKEEGRVFPHKKRAMSNKNRRPSHLLHYLKVLNPDYSPLNLTKHAP